jgi:type IV fimbrial biogenesis protein FimT
MRDISRGEAGFSLIEMAVVLVIFGITLTATIPAFSRLMQSNSLQDAAKQLSGHLRLSRQMAVASGVSHILDWNVADETYLIIRDENENDTPDVGETTTGPFTLPGRVDLQDSGVDPFSTSLVVFSRDGSASESGTVVLSNDRGHSMNLILLAPTGQVRLD